MNCCNSGLRLNQISQKMHLSVADMLINANREKLLDTNQIPETEQSLSMSKKFGCVGMSNVL